MDTGWLIWCGAVAGCRLAAWLVARAPSGSSSRRSASTRPATCSASSASGWRPASSAPSPKDPLEAARWEDAHWHDEVLWARDRQTRRLLALIGVHFDPRPIDDSAPRHATALFEYRKGRWLAEGKRLDEIRPDEAVLRHHRFEAVTPPERRG